MVAWTLGGILGPSPGGASATIPGPRCALEPFVLFATLVSFGGAVVAVWLRFRRGDPVQRQQVKWFVAVVGVGAVVLPVALVLYTVNPELADALSSVAILAMFALPVAIGIAILRYRLYEIDRLISRTIGWAVVTGLLVAVFAAVVIALQAVLGRVHPGPDARGGRVHARRRSRCSSRCGDGSSGPSTAASTGRGTTASGRLPPSPSVCATRSTSRASSRTSRAPSERALRPSSAGVWLREPVPVHPISRTP